MSTTPNYSTVSNNGDLEQNIQTNATEQNIQTNTTEQNIVSRCNEITNYMTIFNEYMDKTINDNEIMYGRYFLVFFVIFSTIIISTVSVSYHYVKYDEYALRLNKYHGTDLSNIYEEGRYFLTLDNSLIYFPSTYQRVNFVSNVFSNIGIGFDIDASFYYILPKQNLGKIYDLYSTSYLTKIETNAKQVIKNVASTFSIDEFILNRSYIEKTIGLNLQTQIYDSLLIHTPYNYFKIIDITFPDILNNRSLDTAISRQINNISLLKQNVNIIKAETNKIISQIIVNTTKINNYAVTKANQIKSNAQSINDNMLLTARTNGLDLFCSKLNITNPSHINMVNKIFSMIDNANNITIFNTQNNIIVNV